MNKPFLPILNVALLGISVTLSDEPENNEKKLAKTTNDVLKNFPPQSKG